MSAFESIQLVNNIVWLVAFYLVVRHIHSIEKRIELYGTALNVLLKMDAINDMALGDLAAKVEEVRREAVR